MTIGSVAAGPFGTQTNGVTTNNGDVSLVTMNSADGNLTVNQSVISHSSSSAPNTIHLHQSPPDTQKLLNASPATTATTGISVPQSQNDTSTVNGTSNSNGQVVRPVVTFASAAVFEITFKDLNGNPADTDLKLAAWFPLPEKSRKVAGSADARHRARLIHKAMSV